jgi:hypothetical protein
MLLGLEISVHLEEQNIVWSTCIVQEDVNQHIHVEAHEEKDGIFNLQTHLIAQLPVDTLSSIAK